MRLRITLKTRLISKIFSKRLQPTHRKKDTCPAATVRMAAGGRRTDGCNICHNTLLLGVKRLLPSKSSAFETKVILLLDLEKMIVQTGNHRVRPLICHLS